MEIEDIKTIDIFKDLSSQEWEALLPLIDAMRVLEGEPLIQKGEIDRRLYIVLSGNFMVYFNDGRAFTLHDKGDIIGGEGMVPALDHECSAVALTNGEILAIPEAELLRLLEADADLADKIKHHIHYRLHQDLAVIEDSQVDEE